MGGYLYHLDHPPSPQHTTIYRASFSLYKPGSYRLLVMLETMRNSSNTVNGDLFVSAVCGTVRDFICMGERVSHTWATVHVTFDGTYLPSY